MQFLLILIYSVLVGTSGTPLGDLYPPLRCAGRLSSGNSKAPFALVAPPALSSNALAAPRASDCRAVALRHYCIYANSGPLFCQQRVCGHSARHRRRSVRIFLFSFPWRITATYIFVAVS